MKIILKSNLLMQKTILFVLSFFVSFQISAQTNHSAYFSISPDDEKRWEIYSVFLNTSQLSTVEKADSIFQFAQNEYQKGLYSKCRELCEIAKGLNPKLSKTHLLIGKCYVSSAEICYYEENKSHKIKEDIIWVAIDEWEKSITKGDQENQAKLLIERYSKYLPSDEHFKRCFSKPNTVEGDEYFVGCWIQKKTRIRFQKDF